MQLTIYSYKILKEYRAQLRSAFLLNGLLKLYILFMLKFVVCVTCAKECGQHFCKVCKKPCHAIPPCCKVLDVEEEGFGAPVVCTNCSEVEVLPKGPRTKEGKTTCNVACAVQVFKRLLSHA